MRSCRHARFPVGQEPSSPFGHANDALMFTMLMVLAARTSGGLGPMFTGCCNSYQVTLWAGPGSAGGVRLKWRSAAVLSGFLCGGALLDDGEGIQVRNAVTERSGSRGLGLCAQTPRRVKSVE